MVSASAPLPSSAGSTSAALLQLRLQSHAKVAPRGAVPPRPGTAPGGMPSLSPARIAPFSSRPCSAGGKSHESVNGPAGDGDEWRRARASPASCQVSGGAAVAPPFPSMPLRPLEAEEKAAGDAEAGVEDGPSGKPSGKPQLEVAKKGDGGDGVEVVRKAPCWAQLFAAHTLVAFALALLGGGEGGGGEGGGGSDGVGGAGGRGEGPEQSS